MNEKDRPESPRFADHGRARRSRGGLSSAAWCARSGTVGGAFDMSGSGGGVANGAPPPPADSNALNNNADSERFGGGGGRGPGSSRFGGVAVSQLNAAANGNPVPRAQHAHLTLDPEPDGLALRLLAHRFERELTLRHDVECARVPPASYVITVDEETLLFRFANEADARRFHRSIGELKGGGANSTFAARTEDSSAAQYFQFYGYLSQQQNMMQDYVRTGTYQRAILDNAVDFRDKVVLDVGAGSGILSFFAAQAGAARVYAVEASNMARHARTLVEANRWHDRIRVLAGKIEEIELPEPVDVIVSEPMGYMLYNERMLETYLHAKKWLRPGGKMFPSRGDLHVAPFTDDALFMEQYNKANFWYQTCFHGVDLSALRTAAVKEYFRQPIVDTFDVRICMAKSVRHVVDFLEADESDLHRIEVPFRFHLLQSGTCHGLAFWFDVAFAGGTQYVWLSTAPTEPLTHWYQVRCLLETPIFVKQGQVLSGRVLLSANKRQSYDVTMDLSLEGTAVSSSNTLDLKNPYFRYTGQPAAAPPGASGTSPSEAYWGALDQTQAPVAQLMDGSYAALCPERTAYEQQNYANINPNLIKNVMLQEDFIKRIGISQNGDM